MITPKQFYAGIIEIAPSYLRNTYDGTRLAILDDLLNSYNDPTYSPLNPVERRYSFSLGDAITKDVVPIYNKSVFIETIDGQKLNIETLQETNLLHKFITQVDVDQLCEWCELDKLNEILTQDIVDICGFKFYKKQVIELSDTPETYSPVFKKEYSLLYMNRFEEYSIEWIDEFMWFYMKARAFFLSEKVNSYEGNFSQDVESIDYLKQHIIACFNEHDSDEICDIIFNEYKVPIHKYAVVDGITTPFFSDFIRSLWAKRYGEILANIDESITFLLQRREELQKCNK